MSEHRLAEIRFPPPKWEGCGNVMAGCACGHFLGRATEEAARAALAAHAADPNTPDQPSWMVGDG